MTFIKEIEYAFLRAGLKRTRVRLALTVPLIYIAAMQMVMFVGHETALMLAATICSIAIVVFQKVRTGSKPYLTKQIRASLHNAAQEELFFSTIEAELRQPGRKAYVEEKSSIFLYATENWLILATPNGCLICRPAEIRSVSTEFRESNSKFDLKLDFFDDSTFHCAYEHIYEPLVELINEKRGSML